MKLIKILKVIGLPIILLLGGSSEKKNEDADTAHNEEHHKAENHEEHDDQNNNASQSLIYTIMIILLLIVLIFYGIHSIYERWCMKSYTEIYVISKGEVKTFSLYKYNSYWSYCCDGHGDKFILNNDTVGGGLPLKTNNDSRLYRVIKTLNNYDYNDGKLKVTVTYYRVGE